MKLNSFWIFAIIVLLAVTGGASTSEAQEAVTNLQVLHKIDTQRFYAYPNGWGSTPEAAKKDLDRVMEIYKDRPGYYRHPYVRIVAFSRNQYQADGCCSFYAADAKLPTPKKPAGD